MNVSFTKQWTDVFQSFWKKSVCCCSKSSSSNLASQVRKISSRSSRDVRASIVQGVGPSGDDELDDEVTMSTKVECDKVWLVGPFTEDELDRRLGLWFPAPRFGVRQGHEGSVRVIDDYSVAGHNGATSVSEKVDVGGFDVVVGMS